MKMLFKILLLVTLLTFVTCGRKGKTSHHYEGGDQGGHDDGGGGYEGGHKIVIPYAARLEAGNHYKAHQRANVYMNRFPGGVNYNHNVNGYGADVSVSFQSYPSTKLSYKGNKY